MRVVCQFRQGTYHLWQTIGSTWSFPCCPSLIDLLQDNEPLREDVICCNDNWESFKQQVTVDDPLLDVGAMAFETLFLKNLAANSKDVADLLQVIGYAFPWCAAHGLDNVRLVFGFESEELKHGV